MLILKIILKKMMYFQEKKNFKIQSFSDSEIPKISFKIALSFNLTIGFLYI